jgi:hypothetical protein
MKKDWVYILLTILWVAGVFEFFYLIKVKHKNMEHSYLGTPLIEIRPKICPKGQGLNKE